MCRARHSATSRDSSGSAGRATSKPSRSHSSLLEYQLLFPPSPPTPFWTGKGRAVKGASSHSFHTAQIAFCRSLFRLLYQSTIGQLAYKQQKLIYHISGGWEAQDRGTSGFCVQWESCFLFPRELSFCYDLPGWKGWGISLGFPS